MSYQEVTIKMVQKWSTRTNTEQQLGNAGTTTTSD